MSANSILRFRRWGFGPPHQDIEPAWHIAAKAYDPKEIYRIVRAVCGYEAKGIVAMTGLRWSKAARRPKGKHCTLCIRKAAEQ
jgi:hypothetical protein